MFRILALVMMMKVMMKVNMFQSVVFKHDGGGRR